MRSLVALVLMTLALAADNSNCTGDANKYTFLIQGIRGTPTALVVREDELDDIELDLRE